MKKQKTNSFFFFNLFSIIVIVVEGIFCVCVTCFMLIAIINAPLNKRINSESQYWLFWMLNFMLILISSVKIFDYLEKKYFTSKIQKNPQERKKIEYINRIKAIICLNMIRVGYVGDTILFILMVYFLALIPYKNWLILFSFNSYFGMFYGTFLISFSFILLIGIVWLLTGATKTKNTKYIKELKEQELKELNIAFETLKKIEKNLSTNKIDKKQASKEIINLIKTGPDNISLAKGILKCIEACKIYIKELAECLEPFDNGTKSTSTVRRIIKLIKTNL